MEGTLGTSLSECSEEKISDDSTPGPSSSKPKGKRKNGGDHENRYQESTSQNNRSDMNEVSGYRVNLYDETSDMKSLFAVAQEEEASGDGKLDIKLPTNSEQYYELEETLMNPARMEGRELTLNAYDMVRAKYNVLAGNNISEADMQSVISSLSCDVCQEVIQGSIMSKKCGHRFCDQCMSISLIRTNNACPACRQNLGSKRELQQDPRFDQLIYQMIESRSILPRMQAKNREKEKDIYFGRKGYVEGNEKYTAVAKVKTKCHKKKTRKTGRNGKRSIRWFHYSNKFKGTLKVSCSEESKTNAEEAPNEGSEQTPRECSKNTSHESSFRTFGETSLITSSGTSIVTSRRISDTSTGDMFSGTFYEAVTEPKKLSEKTRAKETKTDEEPKTKHNECSTTSVSKKPASKIIKNLSRFRKRSKSKVSETSKTTKNKKKSKKSRKRKTLSSPVVEKYLAKYTNSRGQVRSLSDIFNVKNC